MPWVQRVTHLKNRTLAVVLALLLVIASWVLMGWLLIPYIADEIASMTKMVTMMVVIDKGKYGKKVKIIEIK